MPSSSIGKRFGQQADRYDSVSSVQMDLAVALWQNIQKHLPQSCETVLDIGAGTGHLSSLLAHIKPQHLHLLDLSAEMLATAAQRLRREYPGLHLDSHVVDAEHWDGFPHRFDVVASSAALQWFRDVPAFLAQTSHWLVPQGIVGLATFGPRTLWQLHQAYQNATGNPLQPGTQMISEQQLCAWFEKQGFQILERGSRLQNVEHGTPRNQLRDLKSMGVTGGQNHSHLTREGLRKLWALLPSTSCWELVWVVARRNG